MLLTGLVLEHAVQRRGLPYTVGAVRAFTGDGLSLELVQLSVANGIQEGLEAPGVNAVVLLCNLKLRLTIVFTIVNCLLHLLNYNN